MQVFSEQFIRKKLGGNKMGLDVNGMMNAMLKADFVSEEVWEDEVRSSEDEEVFLPKPDENGNFETPALKILRELWDGYFKGTVEVETLQENIEGVYNAVEEQQEMMEDGVDEFDDSPEDPINQDVFEAFEMHKEALDMMQKYFESNDKTVVDNSLKILQDATNLLMSAFLKFIEKAKVELRILCPSCGAENLKGNEKCVKCAFKLPLFIPENIEEPDLIAAEGDEAEVVTTDNYDQIADAVEDWKARDIDDAQLLAELNDVEAKFLAHQKEVLREKSNLKGFKDKEKEVWVKLNSMTEKALEDSLAAIANMKEYFNSKNPANIDRGFESLWDATQEMIKSFYASEEVKKALESQGQNQTPAEEEN